MAEQHTRRKRRTRGGRAGREGQEGLGREGQEGLASTAPSCSAGDRHADSHMAFQQYLQVDLQSSSFMSKFLNLILRISGGQTTTHSLCLSDL